MAFDQYGREQQGQEDFVMQWVQSQLPVEMHDFIMYDKCMVYEGNRLYLSCSTHLSDVLYTGVNQLLLPAIDPEDPSLEYIIKGVNEVNQRL